MTVKMQHQRLLGFIWVASSSLFFYAATVPISLSQANTSLRAVDFTFARFILGSLIFGPIFIKNLGRLRGTPWKFLLARGAANYGAVWCFFRSVETGDPGLANTLNLTYPVFGVALAYLVKDEAKLHIKAMLSVLAFLGIALVLGPNLAASRIDACIFGLSSGLLASIAIKSLQYSRDSFDTGVVLGSMFLFGLLASLLIDGVPDGSLMLSYEMRWLGLASAAGVLGQYLLTYGARYISAVEVGIISTLRILIALFFGWLFVLDQPFGWVGVLGAFLIFLANIGLAVVSKAKTLKAEILA